jgi:hypothetical protein
VNNKHIQQEKEMSIIEELETIGEFLTCSEAKPRVKNHFGPVQEICTCVGFVFCQDPGHYNYEKDMSTVQEIATFGEFLTCHGAEDVQNKNLVGAVDETCTCCGFLFCQDPGRYKNETELSAVEEIATVGEFLTCHDAEAVQDKHLVGVVDEVFTCCGFICCQDPGSYAYRNLKQKPFLSNTRQQDPPSERNLFLSNNRQQDPPSERNVLSPQCYDLDSVPVESCRGSELYSRAPVSTVHVFHSATQHHPQMEYNTNVVSLGENKRAEEHDPLILIVDEDEDDISRFSKLATRDDSSTPSRRYIRNSPMILSYAPPEHTPFYGNLPRGGRQANWSQVPQYQLSTTPSKHFRPDMYQRKHCNEKLYRRGSMDQKLSTRSKTAPSESPSAISRSTGRGDDSIESDSVRAVAPNKFHILQDPSSFIFQEEKDHPSMAPQEIMFEQQPPFTMFQ